MVTERDINDFTVWAGNDPCTVKPVTTGRVMELVAEIKRLREIKKMYDSLCSAEESNKMSLADFKRKLALGTAVENCGWNQADMEHFAYEGMPTEETLRLIALGKAVEANGPLNEYVKAWLEKAPDED